MPDKVFRKSASSQLPKALLTFSLLLLLALIGRLWVLQRMSDAVLGCRWCSIPRALSADLPLLALFGAVFCFSYLIPRRWWSLPWRGLAITGVIVYLVDIFVTAQFATRLSLSDVRIYLGQPEVVWDLVGAQPWWQSLLAVGGVIVLAFTLWPKPAFRRSPVAVSVIALLWASTALLGWMIPSPSYVHDWALRNVITANLDNGISSPYSVATLDRLQEVADALPYSCRQGDATRENIVVLIVESWSTYHSSLWSGLNDWTPKLDQLARDNIHFTRFHAGGFTTNDGLTSLLTGRQITLPVTPPSQAQPFETRWNLENTLPRALAEYGYRSRFITSGNLSFTRKGDWLQSIGFNGMEGHDHASYDGIPRQHFDSVPDDVLYARARKAIRELEKKPKPYFTVIETVSSHHPFIHPYTGEQEEEAVMRFVDQSAADFITDLKTDDFFVNGMLIVVSDHRAMTFVSRNETKLFGRSAASHIPAFIMTGDSTADTRDDLFHQADLPTTLLSRVAKRACASEWRRDMLAENPTSPCCILHARGDHRDRIDVFCTNGEGTVRIDGDESRFLESDGLSRTQRRALLDRIAIQRLPAIGHR